MPANITPVQPVLGFFLVLCHTGRSYLSLTILNMCGIMVLSWEVLRPANKTEAEVLNNERRKGKRHIKKNGEILSQNFPDEREEKGKEAMRRLSLQKKVEQKSKKFCPATICVLRCARLEGDVLSAIWRSRVLRGI